MRVKRLNSKTFIAKNRCTFVKITNAIDITESILNWLLELLSKVIVSQIYLCENEDKGINSFYSKFPNMALNWLTI